MKILKILATLIFIINLITPAQSRELINMNPLLSHTELPDFNKIKPEHFEPAIDTLIENYKIKLDEVCKIKSPIWANTLQKLDEEDARLNFVQNVIYHLNTVNNNDDVRKAFEAVLPKISNFYTDLSQNKQLYDLYVHLKESAEYIGYNDAQKIIIDNAIRSFKDEGINLSDDKKGRLKEINSTLSDLANKFSKNILDATQSWSYHISKDKEQMLNGLPAHTIELAQTKAKSENKNGWVLTLDAPCFDAVMSYAKDRSLREVFYKAYTTRASLESENKQFDNSKLIDEILALRQEKSQIVGYKNYAQYSLSPKMAESTNEVMEFLKDLAKRSKSQGKEELEILKKFAQESDQIADFSPWDTGYYSTQYKKVHYNFSEEDLRPYFKQEIVFQGLFNLANRLYNIKFQEVKDFPKWNEKVRLYEIYDDKNTLRGKFYIDLFARDLKQGGAWVAHLNSRMRYSDEKLLLPIAFLATNFLPASEGKSALLSHSEIETLFHEFGHMLHHTLTKVDYPSVAGTNVAWDYVELPSQFMENWTYVWEVIESMTEHNDTGKRLPASEFDKIIAVKNYNSAMFMLRQLEFALFDFRIHMKSDDDAKLTVQQILDSVRSEVAVVEQAPYNRFQNSFSHIFAGGYAAGYYSYKWAEVLSSDAFSKFEETGLWNLETGKSFLENILESGGSQKPMDLFIKFRGRKPEIDALLKYSGIK